FIRNEAGWHDGAFIIYTGAEQQQYTESDHPPVHDEPEQPYIPSRKLFKALVEAIERSRSDIFLPGMPMMVFQEDGTQHRGRGKGDKGRNGDGAGHGDGKLPVERTYGTRHEGDGHEHGYHHHCNGDNSAADFAEHFLYRIVRTYIRLFLHLGMH